MSYASEQEADFWAYAGRCVDGPLPLPSSLEEMFWRWIVASDFQVVGESFVETKTLWAQILTTYESRLDHNYYPPGPAEDRVTHPLPRDEDAYCWDEEHFLNALSQRNAS